MEVNNVAEEYKCIAQQRCACGGTYKVIMQEAIEFISFHDMLTVQCEKCSSQNKYLFKLSKSYNKRLETVEKKFNDSI